jgi:hypothetical protein
MTDQERLAEQGTRLLRQGLALKMLRAWALGNDYDARVLVTIRAWIDAGGADHPIPWPAGGFFEHWARGNGISNVDGFVGYRMTGTLVDAGDRP